MKKSFISGLVTSFLFNPGSLPAGGTPHQGTCCTPVEPTLETTAVPAAEPILEVISETGSKSLTLDDLKAMAVVEGQAGIKSSTGKITPPALLKDTFKGPGGSCRRHQ